MTDIRVFYPDESCAGFYFATRNDAVGVSHFVFRIPSGKVGVIKEYNGGHTAGSAINKVINAGAILREGDPNARIRMNGALTQILEFGSTQVNSPGIALFRPLVRARPWHLFLEAGLYTLSFPAVTTDHMSAISGWVWDPHIPAKPRPSPNRLFYPDETCSPFLWEVSTNSATNGLLMGTFRLPEGWRGIVASLHTTTGITPGTQPFNTAKVLISPDPGATGSHVENVHGAITEVEQLAAGALQEGYCSTSSSSPRKIRLALNGGTTYTVRKIGGSIGFAASLYGWAWRYDGRAV